MQFFFLFLIFVLFYYLKYHSLNFGTLEAEHFVDLKIDAWWNCFDEIIHELHLIFCKDYLLIMLYEDIYWEI